MWTQVRCIYPSHTSGRCLLNDFSADPLCDFKGSFLTGDSDFVCRGSAHDPTPDMISRLGCWIFCTSFANNLMSVCQQLPGESRGLSWCVAGGAGGEPMTRTIYRLIWRNEQQRKATTSVHANRTVLALENKRYAHDTSLSAS